LTLGGRNYAEDIYLLSDNLNRPPFVKYDLYKIGAIALFYELPTLATLECQ
jgi:hypothetical protein